MHFIFVYFVRGGFRTKIKCIQKVQSKSEGQHSEQYENFMGTGPRKVGGPKRAKISAHEIFWIYSRFLVHLFTTQLQITGLMLLV